MPLYKFIQVETIGDELEEHSNLEISFKNIDQSSDYFQKMRKN